MQKLWKFDLYFYRGGSLNGLFVATDEEVEAIIGETAHFGEVNGKHSEVSEELKPMYFTEVTDDPHTVKTLLEAEGKSIVGCYPFDYIRHEDED